MPSIRNLSRNFLLGAVTAPLASLRNGGAVALDPSKSCSNTQLSCHNSSAVADTCCFESPGGHLLQTQFWDTNPPTGPSNSWTVHGLWPDLCTGGYDANCDASRAYTNITAILQSFGQTQLLNYMDTYWKDYQGDDESFWEHEWGKHGTCISTLRPSCYPDYTPTQEVVDYFQRAVDLFKGLDTYATLAAAGITPSTSKTYTLSAIQNALSSSFGHQVTLQCKSGALDEVWYHYNVMGSVQAGQFVATDPDSSSSSCAASGIKYLPKAGTPVTSAPVSTTRVSSSAAPSGTSSPLSGSGLLKVTSSGASSGCIISAGKWFSTSSCATFQAAPQGSSGGFTLTSSKGACGYVSGVLTCGSGVSAATFTQQGGYLVDSSTGGTTFTADSVPSGQTQVSVYVSGHSTGLQIKWQAS